MLVLERFTAPKPDPPPNLKRRLERSGGLAYSSEAKAVTVTEATSTELEELGDRRAGEKNMRPAALDRGPEDGSPVNFLMAARPNL